MNEAIKNPKIIALDYDGTLALNSYPQAGDPNWPVINKALAEQTAGAKLILWTCREGDELAIAMDACASWGLRIAAVNDNLTEMQQFFGNNPRKIFGNEYWDDRAVNPTVDAVEVIRCRDCKRFVDNKEARVTYCRRGLNDMTVRPDDFCSYGERRSDGTA